MNRACIIGHLGGDPRIAATKGGDTVAQFRVATSESWVDKKTGERREDTEWHSVVVFGARAVDVEARFRKGALVAVEGQLRTRKYTTSAGHEAQVTEIVVQGFGAVLELIQPRASRAAAPPPERDSYGTRAAGPAMTPDLDDEIPF